MSETDLTICVTPTRNEAHNLPRFLAAADMWADKIILLDQCSSDDTRTIAKAHPKVTLIELNDEEYDEARRAKMLFSAARDFGNKNLVIWLDADEALAANCISPSRISQLKQHSSGTVFQMPWIHLYKDHRTAWIPRNTPAFACIDDGSALELKQIHTSRAPLAHPRQTIPLSNWGVLHLNYLDEETQHLKSCWYQLFEHSSAKQEIDPVAAFRMYNGWWSRPKREIQLINQEWLTEYESSGINIYETSGSNSEYWRHRLLETLQQHPSSSFVKCDVWNHLDSLGEGVASIPDPRNWLDRTVLKWLGNTQNFRTSLPVRIADRTISRFIWPKQKAH